MHIESPTPSSVEKLGDIIYSCIPFEANVKEKQAVAARCGRYDSSKPTHTNSELRCSDMKLIWLNTYRISYARQQFGGGLDVVLEPSHVEPVGDRVHKIISHA